MCWRWCRSLNAQGKSGKNTPTEPHPQALRQLIFKVTTLSHIWHFDFNGKTHQVLAIKYVQHSVYQSNLCVLFKFKVKWDGIVRSQLQLWLHPHLVCCFLSFRGTPLLRVLGLEKCCSSLQRNLCCVLAPGALSLAPTLLALFLQDSVWGKRSGV